MKKRNESMPQLKLQILEPTITRPRRTWLTAAILAAQPYALARITPARDAGSWIHRQRLN